MCSNVRLFNELASEIMPGIEVVHLVDEGLPFLSGKKSREHVIRRLKMLASFAEESGAEVAMLTCTAFGRLVDEVQEAIEIPVLSVIEIIAEEAIDYGDRIGILGSHPGALVSASQIIQEQATLKRRKVEIKTLLCAGAFDALRREDWTNHDRIVLEHLNELMEDVAVVVAPQPSIERVLKQVPETSRQTRILPSARRSVQRLKEKLESIARLT